MQRTVLRGVFQKIKKINYAASLPGTEIPHQHWCYHYPFSNPCLCFLFRRILTSLHHSIFPAWLPGYPSFYRTWCNKTSDTVLHFLLLSTDSLNQLFVQVLCTKIPRKGNVLGNICNQGLNNDFPTFNLSTKVYLTRCLRFFTSIRSECFFLNLWSKVNIHELACQGDEYSQCRDHKSNSLSSWKSYQFLSRKLLLQVCPMELRWKLYSLPNPDVWSLLGPVSIVCVYPLLNFQFKLST